MSHILRTPSEPANLRVFPKVLPSNDFAEGARPTLTNTPTTDP